MPYDDFDLDSTLIHIQPQSLYVGEMPDSYKDFFAPVIFNFTRYGPPVSTGPTSSIILQMPFDDMEIVPNKNKVADFLQAAHIYAENYTTYWHCAAGVNRSPMMVAAYLTLYRGIPIESAIKLLRKTRGDHLLNNKTFEKFLLDWLA